MQALTLQYLMTPQHPDLAAAVTSALAQVNDPEIRRPITELGMVDSVTADDAGVVHICIKLTIVGCPAADKIERDVRAAAESTAGVTAVNVTLDVMTAEERSAFVQTVRGARAQLPNQFGPDSLTRVIAVTSGKGGVGKSSLTVGVAVALAAKGLSVGIIDADVHGFSVPGLLGLNDDARPTKVGDLILPPEAFGVRVISIGMFLPEGQAKTAAVAWRGPMLHRTLEQFVREVWFGDLDVLLLDLPPGTGDVALSMGQLLPNAEVLVVTTPQTAAADVAIRSGLVARQIGQRVIGVVENMSGFTQPDGTTVPLFGEGGGAAVAEALSAGGAERVELIARIPLTLAFREAGDTGQPAVLDPNDPAGEAVRNLADRVWMLGAGQPRRTLPVTPA